VDRLLQAQNDLIEHLDNNIDAIERNQAIASPKVDVNLDNSAEL
jgi:hypothetical protein